MLVEAENTPNPNAMKFLCFRQISPYESRTFLSEQDCSESSLAMKLLSIEGIEIVFFGSDFVTLTKKQTAIWELLKPKAVLTLIDHFSLTNKVFDRTNQADLGQKDSTKTETSLDTQIKQILEEYVRPAIAMDGGDLIYHGFENGVVFITLIGACRGCPSSELTLKQGIQTTLQYHIPEVVSVEVAPTQ